MKTVNKFTELSDYELVKYIKTAKGVTHEQAEVMTAIITLFELEEEEINEMQVIPSQYGYTVSFSNQSYLIGTDSQMDAEWLLREKDYVENHMNIPESMKRYFDMAKFRKDTDMDGRAAWLNNYSNDEYSTEINNTYYYAYRQN